MEKRILLRAHSVPQIEKLDVYQDHGGYSALLRAKELGRATILQEVAESGLRGRGGAGFPTFDKWKAVVTQQRTPHYFVCNAAEGEPGSFKDKELLKNPHQVLEATTISAFAVGAEKAFLYLRGLFSQEEETLKRALSEAEGAGLLGHEGVLPVSLIVHRGEDTYIAGEETALLESLEGKRAIPRTKPPRPHEEGLWGLPTAVNNVETICNIISIVLNGGAAFRKNGTPQSPGTKLFCLSGHIRRPGIYELPLGISLTELLHDCGGGPLEGRQLVAIFPGGPSTALVPVALNPAMDFEGLESAGSALGTGGIIVMDDSTDWARVAVEVSEFFARESCGACPPCTIGTGETHRLFRDLQQRPANAQEIVLKIREFCEMMKYRGQCAHNRSAALTHLSFLNHFPDFFSSNKKGGSNGLES